MYIYIFKLVSLHLEAPFPLWFLFITLSIILAYNLVLDHSVSGIIYNKIQSLNKTTTFRIGAVGDVDCNSLQTKEFHQFKKLKAQHVVIPGDYDYVNGNCVLKKLATDGYTPNNTELAVGNHDNCKDVMKFTKEKKCWYHTKAKAANGTVEFFVMDTEHPYSRGSVQYNDTKKWIEHSKAQYKIVVIHEPFITAKSDHGKNGKFGSYHRIFKANNVTLVLQAHNHNYQRFNIDNVNYYVVGTGTHDTSSQLYDINSKDDGLGHKLLKGYEDKNGVAVIDLNIANSTKIVRSWFVDVKNGRVLDSSIHG